MLALDPASEAELEAIGDDGLKRLVDRIRRDPTGQLEPRHRYTRKFRNPRKYISADREVWEFKPSKWRGLFYIARGPSGREGIFFVPVKGRRFMTMSECPWH